MSVHTRIVDEATKAFQLGQHRLAADKYLEAFQTLPSKLSENRWQSFHCFTTTLCEKFFAPSASDFKTLTEIIDDSSEPYLYRNEAVSTLALLKWDQGERDEAAELYRKAIRLAKRADAEERGNQVVVDMLPKSMGALLDENLIIIEWCRAELENPFGAVRPPVASQLGRSDGTTSQGETQLFADLRPERLAVGGSKCDGCGKTLAKLKMKSLLACMRCQRAYYCGEECQKKCWKAGHRNACRTQYQIERGDYMRLKGLQSKPELNGRVAKVVKPVANGRFQVMLYEGNKTISVATEKLMHLRPAK